MKARSNELTPPIFIKSDARHSHSSSPSRWITFFVGWLGIHLSNRILKDEPSPTLQQQPCLYLILVLTSLCSSRHKSYLVSPYASRKLHHGKYLALKRWYRRDPRSCINLYPCLAIIAMLKVLKSWKCIPPSFLGWVSLL